MALQRFIGSLVVANFLINVGANTDEIQRITKIITKNIKKAMLMNKMLNMNNTFVLKHQSTSTSKYKIIHVYIGFEHCLA